jgi:hypothetical protein
MIALIAAATRLAALYQRPCRYRNPESQQWRGFQGIFPDLRKILTKCGVSALRPPA